MTLPIRTALARWTTQVAAPWLFVLPFFAGGIGRDRARMEWIGLAAAAVVTFVAFRQPVPPRAMYRIGLTAAASTLIVCAYLAVGSWPSFGTAHSYDTQAVYFIVTYLAVGAFAVLFFEEPPFERVVWRAATVVLWVGVLSCLASHLSHKLLLVSASHGALRMQGTLSEPSAWAPVIALVVLLAIRRRSRLYLALAGAGTLLAASPTCVLVLLVTVPVYYVLTGTRRQRVTVALMLAAFITAAVFFVQAAQPRQYLDSHNTSEVAVGRLLSGIENVETAGRAGHNTRFASTAIVLAETRANGWILTGAGPAADNTYFPAKFPSSPPLLPDALWVSVLFDYGVAGVVVLGIFMLAAVWRMRHDPQISAILLPFFVASLINSAEGSAEYAFVALGIMLFTFRWAGGNRHLNDKSVFAPCRAPSMSGELENIFRVSARLVAPLCLATHTAVRSGVFRKLWRQARNVRSHRTLEALHGRLHDGRVHRDGGRRLDAPGRGSGISGLDRDLGGPAVHSRDESP